jgi:hypothetical protein
MPTTRIKPKTHRELHIGDIVRSKLNGNAFIVNEIDDRAAKAIRIQHIENMREWEVIDQLTGQPLLTEEGEA